MQRAGAGALVRAVPAAEGAARGRRGCSTPRASGRCRRCRAAIGIVTSLGGAALHDVADDAGAALAACARGRLPEPGAGRRGAGRAVRGDRTRRRRRAEVDVLARLCAAAARSRTCGPSTTSGVVRAHRAQRRCRWSAASATRPTSPLPTSPPTCARRRPPPPPSWSRRRPRRRWSCSTRIAPRWRGARRAGLEREAQRLDRIALRLARPSDDAGAARPRRSTCWRSACAARGAGRDLARRRAAIDAGAARARSHARARRWRAQRGRLETAAIRLRCGRPAPGAGARLCAAARRRRPCACPRSRQLRPGQSVRATLHDGDAGSRCAVDPARRSGAMRRVRGHAACRAASCLQSSRRRPLPERNDHGTHPAPAAVCEGRAGAAPERGDARVPPRQAPQRLCRQPEQPAEGHRVRVDGPRGHRQEVHRRHLQQRRPDLEPHLLLELHEAGRRRRALGRARPRRSRPSGAATPPSRKPSRRARSATSARAGPGW